MARGGGNKVGITGQFDDQISSRLDRVRDKFDQLGRSQGTRAILQGVGVSAGISAFNLLGGAVQGLVEGVGRWNDAASDLNESASKSKVVFGDAAGEIDLFASRADKALGLSKQAALEATATFGNFFTGIGAGQKPAADMSQRLVTLAGDLASFNNIDPTLALEKLRSGLTGEAEPLRSVGVFLNEAKVKAKAMQLGLADAHGELSEGAKILARYQIILDETKTAQGDFARTADGAANSQRIVNAEMENLRAELGQRTLPLEKAWLNLQKDVLGALSDNITKSDAYAAARERLGKSSRGAQAEIEPFAEMLFKEAQGAEAGTLAFRDFGDAVDRARTPVLNAAPAVDALGQAAADLKAAGKKGADGVDEVAGAAKKAQDPVKDLKGDISDLSDAFVEELYGDTVRAGKEADLQGRIKDLAKELAGTANARKATEIKGQLAELRGELFQLHLEQAAAKGPEAAVAFLESERKHAGAAKDELNKLINKYQVLALMQGTLGPIIVPSPTGPKSVAQKKRAGGGPVSPDEMYLVGEQGPELFVPRENGWILPNDDMPRMGPTGGGGSSGGSSGGAVININSVWPPTPAQAREIARWINRTLSVPV